MFTNFVCVTQKVCFLFCLVKWPSLDESVSFCLLTVACNREMQPFLLSICCGIKNSGSGSKFNCAARVGSGQTISGTGRDRASV